MCVTVGFLCLSFDSNDWTYGFGFFVCSTFIKLSPSEFSSSRNHVQSATGAFLHDSRGNDIDFDIDTGTVLLRESVVLS